MNNLCTKLKSTSKWTFIFNADASAIFGCDVPLQQTPTDCGIFVVLYCWLTIAFLTEVHVDGISKINVSLTKQDMAKARLFLLAVVILFCDDASVVALAERSDTSHWVGLKLFPIEKRNTRVIDKLLTRDNIIVSDRMRLIQTYFPATHSAIQYLSSDDKPKFQITLPDCLYMSDEDFKSFLMQIKGHELDSYRDHMIFLSPTESFKDFSKLVASKGWRINMGIQA